MTWAELVKSVDVLAAFKVAENFKRAKRLEAFRALSPRLQQLLVELGREDDRETREG